MINKKVCILKIVDDEFILIDEIHKELMEEDLLLLFTKEKNINNSNLKNIVEKEDLKLIVIPVFFETKYILKLTVDIPIKVITYNDILDHKKTLLICKKNINCHKKNVYFEKTSKLNYDFLFRLKSKYEGIERIISTFYLADIFKEKIENTINSKCHDCNKLLVKQIKKYLNINNLNTNSKEIGTIEFEEIRFID